MQFIIDGGSSGPRSLVRVAYTVPDCSLLLRPPGEQAREKNASAGRPMTTTPVICNFIVMNM